MPHITADRSGYYKYYYLRQKDLRRFMYYEKKERKKEMDELYEEYGGEKAYYKMMYKKWGI
tara:strand:+ start:6047 stop:6229 length:183 start_codon:yes stop_codon:yes gene_type:complete